MVLRVRQQQIFRMLEPNKAVTKNGSAKDLLAKPQASGSRPCWQEPAVRVHYSKEKRLMQ